MTASDVFLFAVLASAATYAIYRTSSIPSAASPAPRQLQAIPIPIPSFPGVSSDIYKAMTLAIDSPGLILAAPTTPHGFEDQDVNSILALVMRKLVGASPPQSIDPHVTDIDSASCVSNTAGSMQFDIIFTFHEARKLTSVKAMVRVVSMPDGANFISEFRPFSQHASDTDPVGAGEVISPLSGEYVLPVGPKI
jgi:hypothetical protein